jgi:hypothetical protein
MSCPGIDPANPFLWVLAAGFFTGAAVSRLAIIPSRTRNPRRVAALKWPLFSIYLSLALLLAAAGLIFSGARQFLALRPLYFFGGVAALSFAGNRFKRVVGAPLFFLLLGWFVYLQLVLSGWSCYSGTEEVVRFRVLDRKEESLVLSVEREDSPDVLETEGPIPEVRVAVLEIEAPYILRGGRFYSRFLGIEGIDAAEEPLPAEEGPHAERLASVLPGMRYFRHSVAVDEEVELFQIYRVVLEKSEITVRAVY